MHEVTLLVGNTEYQGWTDIALTRSIDRVSAEFEVSHTDKWAATKKRRPIRNGERCECRIEGRTVVTGFVDRVRPYYNDTDHAITVGGRSHTADLADCSTVDKQYNGQTLAQIAQSICKPFGIGVHVETEVGAPFDRFSVESETAFGAIERAARQRGVLLIDNGSGELVLTRRGTRRIGADLQLGENIEECSGEISHRDRYSLYTVTGQAVSSDEYNGVQAATPTATVTDPAIQRYRPLRIDAEQQGAGASLKQRAEFERNIRAGRGTMIYYTVQGWYAKGAQLWEPNRLVRVKDDWTGIDRDMLIAECHYSLDDQGTRCEIGVTLPEAYDLIAIPEGDGGFL